jgi:membrane associated rhomboid family serine protease
MGIADRDYYRAEPAPAFGAMPGMTVTTWLIVMNFAVALVDSILFHWVGETDRLRLPWGQVIVYPPLHYWGHFSVATAIWKGQVWRFITFQFLHAGLWHLVVNMLMLYFFGPLVEAYLGRRRFLAFYLICGIAGPIGYMVLWAVSGTSTFNLIQTAYVPLVGASAGLFGILAAAARIAPDETVVVYGVFPMRLRAMAWVMLGIAVWTVFTMGHNAGGEAAHLGGAVVGWLLIRNVNWLNILDRGRRRPPLRRHSP